MAWLSFNEAVAAFERDLVREALARNAFHVGRTADELGMHRNTLTRAMQRLHVDPTQLKQELQRRRPVGSVRPFVARAERIA